MTSLSSRWPGTVAARLGREPARSCCMKRIALPMSLFAILLVACQRTPPAEPVAAEPAVAPVQAPSPANSTSATGSDADWQGYGAAQLGIDADQLRTVWTGELQGDAALTAFWIVRVMADRLLEAAGGKPNVH